MFGRLTKKQYTCGLRTGHNFKLCNIYLVEEQGFTPEYFNYTFKCTHCSFKYNTKWGHLTDDEKEIINNTIGPICKKTSKNTKK
jgi:hypothetical protein